MTDSEATDSPRFTFANLQNRTHQNWWRDPGLRLNVFHCVGCCLCTFYLGYCQTLLTGLQAVPAWGEYFDHPNGNRLGLITASFFLPAIISCIVGGWIANRFGRRVAIWFGALLLTSGGLLNALARNEGEFIGGRAIMGSGSGVVRVAAPALLQEIAHPRLRAVLGGMFYGFFFTGSITSSWMCVVGLFIKGEWGWRFPAVLQVAGPIIVTALAISSPESPRYYVQKGDCGRALDILAKYHANGDKNDELVLWELNEIKKALKRTEDGAHSSYIDFLKTSGNRRRLLTAILLGLAVNWLGNGVISYYLSPTLESVGIIKPLQITCINAGLAMWNLPFAWFGAWSSEHWGRRPLFFLSTWGMFFAFAFTMGLSAGFASRDSTAMGVAVISFLFIFNAFYAIAWTPLPYQYTTEIMPYSLRTKGLAIYTISNQVGNAFNQFVNPIALKNIGWKYYAVYLGLQVGIFLLEYFLFPETRGLSLEEITYVFDHGVNHAFKGATYRSPMIPPEHEMNSNGKEE